MSWRNPNDTGVDDQVLKPWSPLTLRRESEMKPSSVIATVSVPDVPLREPRAAFDDAIFRPDA